MWFICLEALGAKPLLDMDELKWTELIPQGGDVYMR